MSHGTSATHDTEAKFESVTASDNNQNLQRTVDYLSGQSDFVVQYYAHVPYEDIAQRSPSSLAASADAHAAFARQRHAEQCLIRTFVPSNDQHGWTAEHTVVEIVTRDRPFLVRSIAQAVAVTGMNVQQIIHPVFHLVRNDTGTIEADQPESDDRSTAESFMQIHLDRRAGADDLASLETEIARIVDDINLICDDWEAMKSASSRAAKRLQMTAIDDFVIAESCDFIDWLQQVHFTFFGYCEVSHDKGKTQLVRNSGSGIFNKDNAFDRLLRYVPLEELGSDTAEAFSYTKSTAQSPLLRSSPMDIICFARVDKNGKVNGKCVIAGFFTTRVTSTNIESIPILRHKALKIIARSGINPGAHDGKVLINTLESFPRDTLLLADVETIYPIARGIMSLYHHPRVRLFGVQDRFQRFSTCFVYVPSELYSREIRLRIQQILQQTLRADNVEFEASFSSDNSLARMHFFLQTDSQSGVAADFSVLEQQIVEATQRWDDNLRQALASQPQRDDSTVRSIDLMRAIPEAYKEKHDIHTASRDLQILASEIRRGEPRALLVTRAGSQQLCLNLYHDSHTDVPLSKVIHILENMGFLVDGELPWEFTVSGDETLYLREFLLRPTGGLSPDGNAIAERFQHAFSGIWRGTIEGDALNQLIVAAGLNWRQVTMVRCYCRYMQQIKVPYSQDYITSCLIDNPALARTVVSLFEQKFNPALGNHDCSALEAEYSTLLEDVSSLDHDTILRTLGASVRATLRTNYYCVDENGQAPETVAIKLSPALIDGIPLPCPLFEIFVCSPRVEAVHLRGGKVARGGLRWSDRREDFRTEVLGLMKAQMVKNSVIVPVGSKGGFVVKRPPAANASRDELMQEVIECYKSFLRSMLSITDNYRDGQLLAPLNVVRHDEDDPYLVVAADKGTATFSDIANSVSAEFDFWLGDAFASGGSVGYDHKGMGITAKGAWESVKRHFRELGTDTQQDPFTVIGIGDMAGDVFGNGMLLSPHIRLLGAFNHLHIFLDPHPDPATTFSERQRLFNLPRSSWADYDQSLISEGGGIFERSSKSIPLSKQVKAMLDTDADSMTPAELINTMLKARVDLLWNGGIGTYIKAAFESNADAQDKANDAVRVDGSQVRAKVVGEGGNLGCTQQGRIEYAGNGGKIYTDAIDNSAGVDCSDHEVNIKIMVDALVTSGELPLDQRAALLAAMTDEVSELVLRDNYQQTQCISLTHAQAPSLLEEHARFIAALENAGKLNREIEYLPSMDAISERKAAGEGLTTPELAVLVAYSKMDLYEQLLQSPVLEDAYFDAELAAYFPTRLQNEFPQALQQHQLRREIIATLLTNSLVNRLGPTFIFRLQEEIGATTDAIACAFAAARELYQMRDLWAEIESLDNLVENSTQREMLLMTRGWIERGVHWIVNHRRSELEIDQIVGFFQHGLGELQNCVPSSLPDSNLKSFNARARHFQHAGVPQPLAERVSSVVPLSSALDIIEISATQGIDVELSASVYFQVGSFLQLQWLRDQISALESNNHWHTLAISALRTDLHYQHRHLTAEVLDGSSSPQTALSLVEQWAAGLTARLATFDQRLSEIKASESADYAMLSLAVAEVHKLLQAARPLAGTD